MKLQDLHPIDSTILGLDNVYHKIGEHSYFINSGRIQTPKKIITKNKQYLLASTSPQGFDAIVQQVKLLDAYYSKGYLYLFVMDLQTDQVYILDLCMECPEDKCTWLLYDLKNFNKLKDYQAIISYCGKGAKTNKNSVARSNYKDGNNDLLEFEF